jgi:hypothetical protein
MRLALWKWYLSILPLLLAGCSGSSSPEPEPGDVVEDGVCKFAGQVDCGHDLAGIEAILICEVTADKGRVWVLVESCPGVCEAASCLPVDIGTADVGQAETVEPEEVIEETVDLGPPCIPDCDGKICGPDGCDGSCGDCPTDHKCIDGAECVIHCEPQCEGQQCGDDGCDGSCGDCPFNMQCVEGMCGCAPQCGDKECGSDGCGGNCGECPAGYLCSPFGICEPPCQPDCEGKQCGPDGCGSSCGNCPCPECDPFAIYCGLDSICTDQCTPNCMGKQCGDDGCGGLCGFCPCVDCLPYQTECGDFGLCDTGVLTCYDIINCMGACPDTAANCPTDCFLAGSADAQNLLNTLIDCIKAECGDAMPEDCQIEVLYGDGACANIMLDCMFQ